MGWVEEQSGNRLEAMSSWMGELRLLPQGASGPTAPHLLLVLSAHLLQTLTGSCHRVWFARGGHVG